MHIPLLLVPKYTPAGEKDAQVINTDTECFLLMDPSNSGLWINAQHSIDGDFSISSCGCVCVFSSIE